MRRIKLIFYFISFSFIIVQNLFSFGLTKCLAPKANNDIDKTAYQLKSVLENFFHQNKDRFRKRGDAKVNKKTFKNKLPKNNIWVINGVSGRKWGGTIGSIVAVSPIGASVRPYFDQETYVPLKSGNENKKSEKNNFPEVNFQSSLSYEIVRTFVNSEEFYNQTYGFFNSLGGIDFTLPESVIKLKKILDSAFRMLEEEITFKEKNYQLTAYRNNQSVRLEKEMALYLLMEYKKLLDVLDELFKENAAAKTISFSA